MSDYASAPATAMLNSRCSLCKRPLLDAESVEAGMGPICRERAGYSEAGEPDWVAARLAATIPLDEGRGARREVNRLVWWIADNPGHRDAVAQVRAVVALGYLKLAQHLVARDRVCIEVTKMEDCYRVVAPLLFGFRDSIREIEGRRWNRDENAWEVPRRSRADLIRAIRDNFEPGTVLVCGDKITELQEQR